MKYKDKYPNAKPMEMVENNILLVMNQWIVLHVINLQYLLKSVQKFMYVVKNVKIFGLNIVMQHVMINLKITMIKSIDSLV